MMAYSILDLRYHRNGAEEHVYPVVLFGPENVVLADCRYPSSLKLSLIHISEPTRPY